MRFTEAMNVAPLSFLFGSIAAFALGYSSGVPVEGELGVSDKVAANAALISNESNTAQTPSSSGTRFTRAGDGLFYVTASVNGTAVRFLVDSGASVVVLSEADAARIGLRTQDMRQGPRLQTASGSTAMRWSKIGELSVAGQNLKSVDAAVVGDGLTTSLLGQNALTQLGAVTINGDILKIG
jgi:aspartyl protease family protein